MANQKWSLSFPDTENRSELVLERGTDSGQGNQSNEQNVTTNQCSNSKNKIASDSEEGEMYA